VQVALGSSSVGGGNDQPTTMRSFLDLNRGNRAGRMPATLLWNSLPASFALPRYFKTALLAVPVLRACFWLSSRIIHSYLVSSLLCSVAGKIQSHH